jgi:hypothetical protein
MALFIKAIVFSRYIKPQVQSSRIPNLINTAQQLRSKDLLNIRSSSLYFLAAQLEARLISRATVGSSSNELIDTVAPVAALNMKISRRISLFAVAITFPFTLGPSLGFPSTKLRYPFSVRHPGEESTRDSINPSRNTAINKGGQGAHLFRN